MLLLATYLLQYTEWLPTNSDFQWRIALDLRRNARHVRAVLIFLCALHVFHSDECFLLCAIFLGSGEHERSLETLVFSWLDLSWAPQFLPKLLLTCLFLTSSLHAQPISFTSFPPLCCSEVIPAVCLSRVEERTPHFVVTLTLCQSFRLNLIHPDYIYCVFQRSASN